MEFFRAVSKVAKSFPVLISTLFYDMIWMLPYRPWSGLLCTCWVEASIMTLVAVNTLTWLCQSCRGLHKENWNYTTHMWTTCFVLSVQLQQEFCWMDVNVVLLAKCKPGCSSEQEPCRAWPCERGACICHLHIEEHKRPDRISTIWLFVT